MTDTIQDTIKQTIDTHDVVLFMKGTKTMPQCGFSSKVASILEYLNVTVHDVNVLADNAIREGIKVYSDWPTIPQLYIKGEFIGGCDIITEMLMSGELEQVFDTKKISYNKDAAEKLRQSVR